MLRFGAKQSSSLARRHTHAFAFDIDGVLVRGDKAIPGAKEAIQRMQRSNTPFVLLTNGGGYAMKKASFVNGMLGLDNPIKPEQVVLNHSPMRALVPRYQDRLVLVTGMGDPGGVAREHAFKHSITVDDYAELHPTMWPFCHLVHALRDPSQDTEKYRDMKIGAVLVLNEPILWGQDIQIMCDVLASDGVDVERVADKQHVDLYFSNEDMVWQSRHALPRFGAGAFKTALSSVYERYTGRPLVSTSFGKPHAAAYRHAEEVLMEQARNSALPDITRFYMVGDNPMSDIKGANMAGPHWVSILVNTGIGTRQQIDLNDTSLEADVTCADVLEAVKTCG